MRTLVVLCAAALAGTGCGGPAADLFEVTRTGTDRNANLTLLVSDDGTVTCNGRRHPVPGPDTGLRAERRRGPNPIHREDGRGVSCGPSTAAPLSFDNFAQVTYELLTSLVSSSAKPHTNSLRCAAFFCAPASTAPCRAA